jgi:hypothetical protein
MRIVTIAAALTAICGSAVYAQSPSVTELPRARGCSSRSVTAIAGQMIGTTDMKMINDGGWCWLNLTATNGSLLYLPTYRVVKAPAHGTIVMGPVGMRDRVAFKPDAGFIGTDTYSVMNTMTNDERDVTVTVSR